MEQTIWKPRREGSGGESLLGKVLSARGVEKDDETFLRPGLESLHDPFLIPDMQKAVSRLIGARDRGERVTVYADYDVDGTTACAILLRYFAKIGISADWYIPNRLKEGYGMNEAAIERIAARGTDLIVTVDNGVSAAGPAARAAELGMDLIVTDHHEPQDELPEAVAVLDNKRTDSEYPCKELCGAAVAMKLVCALDRELGLESRKTEYLQLAAVATIADIVPLQGENRTIAKLGIDFINRYKARNSGLYALIRTLGIEEVDSGNIGYRIAPAINAAGRLGQAETVMELLLEEDKEKILEAAKTLRRLNDRRRRIEDETLEEAVEIVREEKLYEDDVIVVAGENWHSGVIGIVASRLQDIWHRPVLIAGIDGDGPAKGSGRSVEGFNLFLALRAVGDVFESYGGHEQAAGFSIKPERIPELRERLKAYTSEMDLEDILSRHYRYDGAAGPENLTVEQAKELSLLEPYGQGNPRPLFLYVPEDLTDLKAVGEEGAHLSLTCDGVKAIYYNHGNLADARLANHTRLLIEPGVDEWKGKTRVDITIRDMAKKKPG